METSSPRPSRPILISTLCILAVGGVGVFFSFAFRQTPLASPPSTVRPWAEARFLKLTKPVTSPGKPTDPQYLARHGGSGPSKNPNYQVAVIVEPPAVEFVPAYEVIAFDASDGFTAKARSGAIRWLSAKPYDLPPNWDDDPKSLIFTPFHPDGRPMSETEASAMSLTQRDLSTWGYELQGELGTAVAGVLDFKDFENLQYKFQDVFDATTHVSVRQRANLTSTKDGLHFGMSLAILHDAPLLAVIDLAHGKTRDFTLPVAKGATVTDTDFNLEVIDVIVGTVNGSNSDRGKFGKAIEVAYGTDSSTTSSKSFSVIYQINPPSMTTAVSVDAIDAEGNVIENDGRFMEDAAPVSRFAAPLATATSLRVRCRSHQTRLLLKMKSLPGVTAPNLAPTDLFDVQAPQVTFRDSFSMRRFIASGTQLQDITGSWSHDTPTAFPMTLTDVSPRQVAERYLALDRDRRIKIDPAALTIEFEQPRKPTWLDRTWIWLKSLR